MKVERVERQGKAGATYTEPGCYASLQDTVSAEMV